MRNLLFVGALLLMVQSVEAAESSSFNPGGTFLRIFATALDGVAHRVESAEPESVKEQILSWESQLGWLNHGVDLLEGYFPHIKTFSDPIQEQMARLQGLAADGDLESIAEQQRLLAGQLKAFAGFLRQEADRMDNEGDETAQLEVAA